MEIYRYIYIYVLTPLLLSIINTDYLNISKIYKKFVII